MTSRSRNSPTARIGLIESQPATAVGLAQIIDAGGGMKLLWSEVSLQDGLLHARVEPVDVLIIDHGLGEKSVIAALEQFRSFAPEVPALIWGTSISMEAGKRLITCGARGWIEKTASPSAMLTCLTSLLSGGIWPRSVGSENLDELRLRYRLTAREGEVLKLLTSSRNSREIAAELGIAAGTLKIHCRAIYLKLKIHRRGDLANLDVPFCHS